MSPDLSIGRVIVVCAIFSLSIQALPAQAISGAQGIPPVSPNTRWTIEVSFAPAPPIAKMKQLFVIDLEDAKVIALENLRQIGNFYTGTLTEPLEVVAPVAACLQFRKHYEVRAAVENDAGDEILSLGAELEALDANCEPSPEERVQANDADDADIYFSGEINTAKKRDASFTTAIQLQRHKPISASWRYTPFFKLNASTDADADPDSMEIGLKIRYIAGTILGFPGGYFDNEGKLESERDLDNSNFIYAPRLTFLAAAFPMGAQTRYKGFFNPYAGTELGKNLKSPVETAEGDGLARLLAGADLRFAFFLKNGAAPDLNWTASYKRRWLLTDELGFETDEEGNLQLVRFDKNPRDYVLSKVSYALAEFLDVFAAYEWGQAPPSYKLVDHRFQLGFAYKYKFEVK